MKQRVGVMLLYPMSLFPSCIFKSVGFKELLTELLLTLDWPHPQALSEQCYMRLMQLL